MLSVIKIRSFLAANSEKMLENIAVRRQAGKIDAEDLFGSDDSVSTQNMIWEKNTPDMSKINILLQEKESLGLYVSGNPLDDYRDLLQWCRHTSGRDDIFLVLIDKIKKIFTKTNAMMFALQISTPDLNLEGVIFPKNALNVSSILEEKELYWVQGKIQETKRKSPESLKAPDDEAFASEESTGDVEIKEFDELPKLIINNIHKFEDGVLPLFANEEIPLAINRESKFKNLDWKSLKIQPTDLNFTTQSSQTVNNSVKTIRLEKSIGAQRLKEIIATLQKSPFSGGVEVYVEVENSEGFKKAKGTFWVTQDILNNYSVR
jgi:DNA polymerase III alpha subunit